MGDHPVVPDYAGACVTNIVPALCRGGPWPDWFPTAEAGPAERVVLCVLDGLGWHQWRDRRHLTPTMAEMAARPIHTVAPTTTAAALTSITTGLPPGEHGVVGYRIRIGDEILNTLRWRTEAGDARLVHPPEQFAPAPPFCGRRPPVVTKAEFAGSGFTGTHLAGVDFRPWRVPSTLVVEVRRAVAEGAPLVYCYYEGADKVAHEYGLGEHFDAELVAIDRLVADLWEAVGPGGALIITSDHGMVHVGDAVRNLAPEVLALTEALSGEGRFRWLHAPDRPGAVEELTEAARAAHGDEAWVVPADEAVMAGWFGPHVTAEARARLGDVAVVAREPIAFHDPADTGPYELVGRHGSLTAEEVDVPLLVGRR